jgi:phosphomannomutase
MSLINSNVDKKKCIFLFDMDGTLTKATCKCDISVARVLEKLKKYVNIGIVSGSSLDTITYQFQPNNSSLTVYDIADYIFSQNGTVARFHGTCLGEDFNIQSHLGESQLQELLNFILRYIADLSIPIKRGTFIQLRTAMINISPIGRDCSLKEREAFFEYDKIHHVRLTLIQHLEKNFKHLNLRFAVGGQISIDCYPIGWDKSFCLRHLSDYDSIYFFGDKTSLGGNDYEIYNHPNVIGQTVKSPEDTVHHLEKFLNSLKKDD